MIIANSMKFKNDINYSTFVFIWIFMEPVPFFLSYYDQYYTEDSFYFCRVYKHIDIHVFIIFVCVFLKERKISINVPFLCRDGTTDVTRTVHFGMPSDYEKVF